MMRRKLSIALIVKFEASIFKRQKLMAIQRLSRERDHNYKNIYNCVNCSKDTYFLVRDKYRILVGRSTADVPSQEIHHFPVTTPTSHQSVPEEVKDAMVEAEKCLSVGAFNACGVMARRAIHVLCQDKKAKGRDLFEQLIFLRDNNLITPDIWEWTEELRIVGRSGAHPEWEDVSREDAHYAVRFLREIIRYVYINPFERSRRKLKETKKKTEKS